MKKKGSLIYLIIGMFLCLTPLLGMLFVSQKESGSEQRRLAKFPKLVEEGKWNTAFLSEAGRYFEDHFAFREEMVGVNSKMEASLFLTSAVDTVVVGTDGWLYYSDSLPDYLGDYEMSEGEAFCLAQNLSLMQRTLKEKGIRFLFTIAPNKNSLYGEHMPYYDQVKAERKKNVEVLLPQLKQQEVAYADLFAAFSQNPQVRYRKQDSHWDGRGAALAADVLLNQLSIRHPSYSKEQFKKTKTEKGDLATALYGALAEPEWDYELKEPAAFRFLEGTRTPAAALEGEKNETSWEDYYIRTIKTEPENQTKEGQENQSQEEQTGGRLLMFRDSFGNTLCPFLAEAYQNAAFSKETVYHMDQLIEQNQPDTVIVEIVERNLRNLVIFDAENQQHSGPPVMLTPIAEPESLAAEPKSLTAGSKSLAAEYESPEAVISWEVSKLQPSYEMIYGELPPSFLQEDLQEETKIFVEWIPEEDSVEQANADRKIHEAFLTVDETGEIGGYVAYFPVEMWKKARGTIRILKKTKERCLVVAERRIS